MAHGDSKVLVVDDEEIVTKLFAHWLSDVYTVRTATSGGRALEILDDTFDVVLLDRRMPGMNGDEVLDEIQRRDVDCQVAMVTAVDPDLGIVDLPIDTYLTKPVSEDQLIKTVEQLATLASRTEEIRQEFALREKRAAIAEQLSEEELQESEEYAELIERLDELQAEVEERVSGINAQSTDDEVEAGDPDENEEVEAGEPDETTDDDGEGPEPAAFEPIERETDEENETETTPESPVEARDAESDEDIEWITLTDDETGDENTGKDDIDETGGEGNPEREDAGTPTSTDASSDPENADGDTVHVENVGDDDETTTEQSVSPDADEPVEEATRRIDRIADLLDEVDELPEEGTPDDLTAERRFGEEGSTRDGPTRRRRADDRRNDAQREDLPRDDPSANGRSRGADPDPAVPGSRDPTGGETGLPGDRAQDPGGVDVPEESGGVDVPEEFRTGENGDAGDEGSPDPEELFRAVMEADVEGVPPAGTSNGDEGSPGQRRWRGGGSASHAEDPAVRARDGTRGDRRDSDRTETAHRNDRTAGRDERTHRRAEKRLAGSAAQYGFVATLKTERGIARHQTTSNDIAETFDELLAWYADQMDDELPPEETLRILFDAIDVDVRDDGRRVRRR